MKKIEYPIRLNKYLAYSGFCSRREADSLISEREVYVNGSVATLGMTIVEDDKVELHRGYKKKYLYIAYNKPRGVVTHSPQHGEIDIATELQRNDVFPIGRLDKDSEGLIILTNDGRVTEKLLSPESNSEKEYVVTVDKTLTESAVKRISKGVNIEGYMTKPSKAKKLQNKSLSITLTEGKKHQIRRMLAALGYTTIKLRRVRIGSVTLDGLEQNKTRSLKAGELKNFLSDVGL